LSVFGLSTAFTPTEQVSIVPEAYFALEFPLLKIDEDIVDKLSPRHRRGARDVYRELADGVEGNPYPICGVPGD
jgi:hypothetical protein